MGRASIKENKTVYQLAREACGLTRAEASEKMEWVSESRIEKIELEKSVAAPEEVLAMSKAYRRLDLCNHYCSHDCPIGRKYVPEIHDKPIEKTVLEMLATLNRLEKQKDRLIEITSDGTIHDDEIRDFLAIRAQLARMRSMVDSLQLWFDNTVEFGRINMDILRKEESQTGE